MMDYFNEYRSYVNHVLDKDSIMDNAKQNVSNMFDESFFTDHVVISGAAHHVILKQTKNSKDKKLILKPGTTVNVGDAVEISNSNFLLMDFLSEGIYEIYPSAKIQLCNNTIPIPTGEVTKTDTGETDFMGDPVYEETQVIDNVHCVVDSRVRLASDSTHAINLPEGNLHVTMKYMDSSVVSIGNVFTMYGKDYFVTDIDYSKVFDGIGIMTLNMKWEGAK